MSVPAHPDLELLAAGPDPHCGCHQEEWLVDGVDVTIHFEDGGAGAYLDAGDWDDVLDMPVQGDDLASARDAIFAWAHGVIHTPAEPDGAGQ